MLSADFAAAAVLIRYVEDDDGDGDENDEQILFHLLLTGDLQLWSCSWSCVSTAASCNDGGYQQQ